MIKNDLASIRKRIGKSQSEMGRLLGISTRSLQSYEQGWRIVPPHVLKLADFYLALSLRKDAPRRKPCWTVLECPPDKRDLCLAYQLDAGDLCWLVTGNSSCGLSFPTWSKKVEACLKCPVMKVS